ncbi:MAG: 1-acyl-sn-glycerol-3-phosphate acyltransferase [Solirubrobacterales bacterium]
MNDQRLRKYHEFSREHGVNRAVYLASRLVMVPFFLAYFRLSRIGRDHAPLDGPLLVAANHRSFLDPFVIGATLPFRRPMHYLAKVELFRNPLIGWFLSRLGAIPIRRGASDEQAMETARMALERGGAVCIFPEGTRITSGSVATPRRGVGRLALQAGAQVLPAAVHGSEHARVKWRIRPRKVKVRLGRPVRYPRVEQPSPKLAAEVTDRIWPTVSLMWEWLGGLPPMRSAAVIGAGSWGTAVASLLAQGGVDVRLGTRTREHAEEIRAAHENERYLPGVRLPDNLTVARAGEIELAAVDLVVFAVPSKSLPQAVGSAAARIGGRSAVLTLAKGLVDPQGRLPSRFIAERVRCRAVACLGGPAHAAEAVAGDASLVLASEDEDLREQLGVVFDRAGVACERSDDIVGVEVAGVAKNATALAVAAKTAAGMNAAGAAGSAVWRECVAWGRELGAEPETFLGDAGIGDLTATVLAPGSRNRRAGELLAEGVAANRISDILGQTSEAIHTVPLLAETVGRHGLETDALDALAALIGAQGTIDAEEVADVAVLPSARRG